MGLSMYEERPIADRVEQLPFFIRGGSGLFAIEQRAIDAGHTATSEYNEIRGGIDVRRDHSLLARYVLDGLPQSGFEKIVPQLGYREEDFESKLLREPKPGCWVLSFAADVWTPVYRHNATGAFIPFVASRRNPSLNTCGLSDLERRALTKNPILLKALEKLSDGFEFHERIPELTFKENIRAILEVVPAHSDAFVLLNSEIHTSGAPYSAAIEVNRWLNEIAADFRAVKLLPTNEFQKGLTDYHPIYPESDFSSTVYMRAFDRILEELASSSGSYNAPSRQPQTSTLVPFVDIPNGEDSSSKCPAGGPPAAFPHKNTFSSLPAGPSVPHLPRRDAFDGDYDEHRGGFSAHFSVRGGVDLFVIEDLAREAFGDVVSEYNRFRNGIDYRLDHSLMVRYAIDGLPDDAVDAVYRLGYTPADFRSSLFGDPRLGCWVLSFVPDNWVAVYKHNTTGALVPFVAVPANSLLNICELSAEQRLQITEDRALLAAMETLASEFSYVGRIPEATFKSNLYAILSAIPSGSRIFLLLGKEYYGVDNVPSARAEVAVAVNRWIRAVAANFVHATPIAPDDFIVSPSEIHADGHLDRAVAKRIYCYILQQTGVRTPATSRPDARYDAQSTPTADLEPLSRPTTQAAAPVSDVDYRCPSDFRVSPTKLRRVMVIGSCLISGLPELIGATMNGCPCDFLLVNNRPQVPNTPPKPPADYDFQMIQVPLRSILPDLDAFGFAERDLRACEALLLECADRLADFLESCMRWNIEHGLLTFVWNFMLPQQNPLGRLLPRYDLRNPVHFIEKLNEVLASQVAKYRNAHLFDLDQLVASFGRRYFQDDMVWQTNHNSALTNLDFEHDTERLEGPHRASDSYPLDSHKYVVAVWSEMTALYRTIRQVDQVKLVIMDIDDTLWRGVGAEQLEISSAAVEGWPLGLADALHYLRRRGVLLAIVSKNDEGRVAQLWGRAFGPRLKLEDFAVRKINWRPKAENIEELLRQVNLLPNSVVFIDDNPVERAAVEAAFPGIRTLGPNPLLWRRILLWAPETQVATITAESASRTEMIQAQVEREEQRQRLSRGDFLASLDLQLRLTEVSSVNEKAFPRVLELINKTNQFNTTGQRWTEEEFRTTFAKGARVFAFDVADRFTAYGIVGIVVVDGACIQQFVMSCRVAGMEVEIAIVAEILHILADLGVGTVRACLVETPLNLLARDLYERCGFDAKGGDWWRDSVAPIDFPVHIKSFSTQRRGELIEA